MHLPWSDVVFLFQHRQHDEQVKKAMLHRKHVQHLLETQLELLKNFSEQEE